MPAGVSVGTFTLSARNMMWSPLCTPVVADVAPAPLSVGEVPVAWRAFVAILTKDWLERKKNFLSAVFFINQVDAPMIYSPKLMVISFFHSPSLG